MTTIAQTSVMNAEYSFNAWLRAQLTAITLTSETWLSTPGIYTNNPEATANLPAFSVNHIPVTFDSEWQGHIVDSVGGKGLNATQIAEVNCWVSRKTTNWLQQLRTMQDMVLSVLAAASDIVISDYVTNPSSPASTVYLLRLRDARATPTVQDPNPDIERRRVLVTYEWIYRS